MAPEPVSVAGKLCAPRLTLEGHTSGVLALAVTQNDRYLLSASQDKTLRLWNPHTGVHVKTYSGPHNYEVNDVIIGADNAKFISCGGDQQFFQWDVTTAQVIRKFVGHDRKVNALAFGPGQDVVLSASHDRSVRIWDLRSRDRGSIQALTEAADSVLCVAAAGDEIATGSADGGLRRYDVRMGQLVIDQLLQPIGSVSFSKDRQCMLVSTLDHIIRLLDRETGSQLGCYKGHANERYKVQSTLDPSDAYVVSGSEDRRVCLWDIEEETMIGSLNGHGGPVFCVRFIKDTFVTAAADGVIRVWTAALAAILRPTSELSSVSKAALSDAGLPSSFGRRRSLQGTSTSSATPAPLMKAACVDTVAPLCQDKSGGGRGAGTGADALAACSGGGSSCDAAFEVSSTEGTVRRRGDRGRKGKRKELRVD